MPGTAPSRLAATLNDAFLLLVLGVLAAILSAAMVLQYAFGEVPCPLCLLQRAAMFGVCFGILRHFRDGASDRSIGIAQAFGVLLLVVAVRQTLLDIAPRPGHAYVGSAVLGLHMPVWSVLIAVALLLAFAVKMAVLGGDVAPGAAPPLVWAARLLGGYVLALCAVNLVSVVVQCGVGQCHTMGYRLLE
ncbi:disulfide bond formation protein B [Roseomonas sp. CECT 9278]|uniref:disulfide bond formation protein B n=1 Tax=Roseomonas sp. CECT 9278 TaxID=2845823 RepID=UPI001E53E3FA|nr:disulfide bond formation protein B [Roseomonas sp. CECT 9278]CAH0300892.1 Disulfide bond formation protein B [Roseomonas sp. CECT 9278]